MGCRGCTKDRRIDARLSLDNLTDALLLDHGSGFYRPGFGATAALTARIE